MSAAFDWDVMPETQFERGDHIELAHHAIDILKRSGYGDPIIANGGDLWAYKNGIFRRIPRDDLPKIVQRFAGLDVLNGKSTRPLKVNDSTVRGVVNSVHAALAASDYFDTTTSGIAFRDVFVQIRREGVLVGPHSPLHRARHQYDFAYESAQPPVKFLQFLSDVFRDDPDRSEKIAAIQEFVGAAIIGAATQYERALLLLGPGANGKTRLVEVIEQTMPEGSICALPPHLWGDQYQRPILSGALLNVVPDLTDDELGPAAKGIISGEGLAARNPGSAAFSFKARAAHVFGANQLPKTRDRSNGFWRRWLIIPMTRSFLNDPARDPDIVAKIVPAELPGIVHWALQGAARLLGRSDYTLPTSHHLALARWRGVEDAVRLFVETKTRPAEPGEKGELASNLLAAFNEWTQPFGVTKTKEAFASALTAMGLPGSRTSGDGTRYAVRLTAP